jgi:hypothetical protein
MKINQAFALLPSFGNAVSSRNITSEAAQKPVPGRIADPYALFMDPDPDPDPAFLNTWMRVRILRLRISHVTYKN